MICFMVFHKTTIKVLAQGLKSHQKAQLKKDPLPNSFRCYWYHSVSHVCCGPKNLIFSPVLVNKPLTQLVSWNHARKEGNGESPKKSKSFVSLSFQNKFQLVILHNYFFYIPGYFLNSWEYCFYINKVYGSVVFMFKDLCLALESA